MKTNKRVMTFDNQQFRAEMLNEGDSQKKIIRGYPILFETPAKIYGEWQEIIDKNALETTDLSELRLLVDHNTALLLARAGINLRTNVDDIGLFIEAEMPNTTLANDTFELVKLGILDGMSYWFNADKIETDYENKIDRILNFSKIYEISLVTFPAYKETVAVTVEKPNDNQETDDELEQKDDSALKNALLKLLENM